MSIAKLQGLPAQPPFDAATVDKVKDLLNSGDVDIGDVSNYFNVEKSLVMQSLTDIPPNAYESGNLDAPQVAAIQNLIKKGVASTKDVSQYFNAPEEIVERNLTEQLGFSPSQIAQARQGSPVTERKITERKITDRPQTANDIQVGLLGSEQALTGGAQAAIDRLDALNAAGRQDLQSNYQTGLDRASAQAEIARGDITENFGRAEAMFDPYRDAGSAAIQKQAALSGALGQEAFDQAYQESPQMAFLREQGMRANLSGAAATGGLGGGNVQKELQRFGQGLASQGLQQQIANLGVLSGQGLGASGSAATIATGAGANLANIASNLGSQQLQTYTNLGNQLANYGLQTGLPAAQMLNNLGINLAQGRTQEGIMRAQDVASTGANLADIYASQGANIANLLAGQRDYLSGIYGDATRNEALAQQGYGANMANLQGNIASGISGVPQAQLNNPDYQSQLMNALYAAGTGYEFGKQNFPQGQQQSGTGRFNIGAGFPQGYFNQPTAGAQTTGMNYDPKLYAAQQLTGMVG